MHYNGKDIPDPPTHPEFADAIYHWDPVISPSGISLLYRRCHSGLEGQPPHRRAVGASDRAAHPRRREGDGRGADSHGRPHPRRPAGPDGSVYALTDEGDGKILRLTLENSPK